MLKRRLFFSEWPAKLVLEVSRQQLFLRGMLWMVTSQTHSSLILNIFGTVTSQNTGGTTPLKPDYTR